MTKKEFIEKRILNIFCKNKDISCIDVYGVINSLLISGDRHIPVYLLSFLQIQSKLFINKNHKKNEFYCGQVLFKKYDMLKKKKIVIITGANKKSLFFDSMPISFYQGYNFGWDDWNEKAIIIPIESFENYFELPSIEFINVYVRNKTKIKEIIDWIKQKFNNEINYIDFGINVLPEYNKFLVLLKIITNGILFLIFVFSCILLLILINLYIYQNKDQFYFLIIMGIKNIYIKLSILLFFFFISIISILSGFLYGFLIINIINYYNLIVISNELQSYFICIVNWNFIYYYILIYLIILFFGLFYYYKKNIVDLF